MSNRTMKDVVDEYNSLTGEKIKRFATVEVGEKRLALAKASKPVSEKKQPVAPKTSKPVVGDNCKKRVTVNKIPYRSVFVAFEALGLPVNKHIKFRAKLKLSGDEVFEHEGKKYHFVVVKQESLV